MISLIYLNTSYVEVKRSVLALFCISDNNLNTSYVEVKLTKMKFSIFLKLDLNTSYVEVKQIFKLCFFRLF